MSCKLLRALRVMSCLVQMLIAICVYCCVTLIAMDIYSCADDTSSTARHTITPNQFIRTHTLPILPY